MVSVGIAELPPPPAPAVDVGADVGPDAPLLPAAPGDAADGGEDDEELATAVPPLLPVSSNVLPPLLPPCIAALGGGAITDAPVVPDPLAVLFMLDVTLRALDVEPVRRTWPARRLSGGLLEPPMLKFVYMYCDVCAESSTPTSQAIRLCYHRTDNLSYLGSGRIVPLLRRHAQSVNWPLESTSMGSTEKTGRQQDGGYLWKAEAWRLWRSGDPESCCLERPDGLTVRLSA